MKLHKYQISILEKLMYNPDLRFSDLTLEGLTSEHFAYHLNKLMDLGLVKKEDSKYILTDEGKELVGNIDEESMKVEKNPKVSVLIYIKRTVRGEDEYLMMKRLKQPYYGKVGNLTGKVKYGEMFDHAAKRELMEETGLKADIEMRHIYHKLRFDKKRKCLQDNIFLCYLATNPKGNIVQPKDAEWFWIKKKDLFKRDDLFDDVIPHFKEMMKEGFRVYEDVDKVEGY